MGCIHNDNPVGGAVVNSRVDGSMENVLSLKV